MGTRLTFRTRRVISVISSRTGPEHFHLKQEKGKEFFNNAQNLDVDRSGYVLYMYYAKSFVFVYFP